jgi:flagellar capping protein FliD
MLLTAIIDYEDLGLKSLLIAAVIGMAVVVKQVVVSKDLALKEKDDRIREVILNHQNDLKEANNDMKVFVEKYHQFTQNLKDLLDVRK